MSNKTDLIKLLEGETPEFCESALVAVLNLWWDYLSLDGMLEAYKKIGGCLK